MAPEVNAIIENFTDIDVQVYNIWLKGLSGVCSLIDI